MKPGTPEISVIRPYHQLDTTAQSELINYDAVLGEIYDCVGAIKTDTNPPSPIHWPNQIATLNFTQIENTSRAFIFVTNGTAQKNELDNTANTYTAAVDAFRQYDWGDTFEAPDVGIQLGFLGSDDYL